MKASTWFYSLVLMLALGAAKASAYDPKVTQTNQTPRELQGIGIKEKLGDSLDLSLPFVDDTGRAVTLGQYFKSNRPVLLTIVYYNCPSLCNFHLNGVTEALKSVKWQPGQEFELVTVSMDPTETHEVAGPKKAAYVKEYGREQSINGWHFLTGKEENIKKLAAQIGFGYRWDDATKQYAHASAAVVVTPGGVISRYVHGISPEAKTLRLALLEASGGKVGSLIDQIVMFCFHFDPKKSKYTLAAWNIMQVGAVLTLLIAAVLLIPFWIREYARKGPA
ncbi:MAG: SCO family protein [Bdellovibrionales bacterium]